MYYPSFKTFEKLTKDGTLIPIYREILADMDTPVSTLSKLQCRSHAFLLESVEGGEKWGRYTFLGSDPRVIFSVRGSDVTIQENGRTRRHAHKGDPLIFLKRLMARYRTVSVEGLPRFYGGAVGFLSYDMVRYFEKLPTDTADDMKIDEATFLITDTLIIFDNVRNTIKVVSCVYTDESTDLFCAYNEGLTKIDEVVEIIKGPLTGEDRRSVFHDEGTLQSTMSPNAYTAIVERAKDYIAAGDAIQVVLSQRFEKKSDIDPVDLYRALRYINPSPYLFYLALGDLTLIGSSPEVMVRLEEGTVELRPIAGTRKRGDTEQDDRNLANELLQDPKERAEHIMLVDLGRNDLGRIARIGSVQVTQLMAVERYSHVMHLVSNIRAQLAPDKDCFDVIKATFPAGTLTGAPKIRAMEIIEKLESTRRGPYGGAVGYLSYTGNMDLCITIRSMVINDRTISVQTGAGIVSDSDPSAEYQETVNKAQAMMQAIQLAASQFKITSKEGEAQ